MAEDDDIGFDLSMVQTVEEFARACDRLRGTRSYSELGRRARPRSLPAATLSDLLNGRSTPVRETVVTFLVACGLGDDAEQQPWLAAWERVATRHQPRPVGAIRVREARPRLLGVHAAIQVNGAEGDLPAYVPRDFDADLRTALTAATRQGGFVLLVGGSSVGKTRALVEAVRSVMPEWWLIHPDPAEPEILRSVRAAQRTIIWLDELQRYLDQPDGLSVGAIRELIMSGVVVVATLWPHEHGTRTAPRIPGKPDPHANDRELLALAQIVRVPDEFSRSERLRAERLAGDQRIRIALDTPDAGFTQVLAAGPALIDWWENAREHNCYGYAVITAALDARRVGAHAALTQDYFFHAAPGYLTPRERAVAPNDWLQHALATATTPLHGAAAAISPIPTAMGQIAGYAVADFLHQHARRTRRTTPVPQAVWKALVDYHHPADTIRLSENAYRRMAPYSEALLSEAIAAGSPDAWYWLADLLAQSGQVESATAMLQDRANAGDERAADQLAEMLAEYGQTETLRARSDAGDRFATAWLADLLAEQGEREELEARADAGDRFAAVRLVDLLTEEGKADEALSRLTAQADGGDSIAARLLAERLAAMGRTEEATALFRASADAGDFVAISHLERMSDEESWIDAVTARADAGDFVAAAWLIDLLVAQGRIDELQSRAMSGDGDAAMRLADLWMEQGRVEEARTILQAQADSGDSDAAEQLANLLAAHGGMEQAIKILREKADGGSTEAGFALSDLLAEQRLMDDLEAEVNAGTPGAARRLRMITFEKSEA